MAEPTSDAHKDPSKDALKDPAKEPRSLKRLGVLMRLLALVTPYRARFAVATLALIVASGVGLLYPQAAKMAVDSGIAHKSPADLDRIALGLLAVFLGQALFVWLRHYM